jgi:TetR/AcrR family transcriptional regulator, repressor for uid operon
MPKLKPDVQRARREHILDAAEQCFARTGFHRTSIHDICKQAAVSPGALYVYFDSKEALIAGICERDRAEFADRIATLATAPDFMDALRQLGEQYFLEEPVDTHRMCIDVGLESTRNPRIGEIHQRFDRFITDSFETLFQKLKDEGRIAPSLDIPTTVKTFMVISDGMFWRRAVDPDFNAQAVMPAMLALVTELLKPVAAPQPALTNNTTNPIKA